MLLGGLHVGYAVPEEPSGHWLRVCNPTCHEYVVAAFRVGYSRFDTRPFRKYPPALEPEAAARHVFTLDDCFPTLAPDAGRGSHGGTFFSSFFLRFSSRRFRYGGTFLPPIARSLLRGPSLRHSPVRLSPGRRGVAAITMTCQHLLRFKNVLFNFTEQDGLNGVTTAAFQGNRRWGRCFGKCVLPRIHGTIYEGYGIHLNKLFITDKVRHSGDGLF